MLVIGCGLTLVEDKLIIVIGRFIQGLSAGTFSVFVPSFINEITPTELKGPIGCSTQLFITLGLLIAYLLGMPFPNCIDGGLYNLECKGYDVKYDNEFIGK